MAIRAAVHRRWTSSSPSSTSSRCGSAPMPSLEVTPRRGSQDVFNCIGSNAPVDLPQIAGSLEPSLAPLASLPATLPQPHRGLGSRADSLLDSGRRAEQRQIVCPRGYPDPDPGFAIVGGHSPRLLAEHCGARLPPPWVRHCDPQVPPFSPCRTPRGPPDSDTHCAPLGRW